MLEALIFDVDGTLVNSERDGHLRAFNLTFKQFGLNWVWSNELYHDLLRITGGKERLKYYLDTYHSTFTHNDLDNFIATIHQHKTSLFINLMTQEKVRLRVGVDRLLNEAKASQLRLAIATTTSLENVNALISSALGADFLREFEVIAAGDIVEKKKPASDIYTWTLEKMGLSAQQCLAFEDSNNGFLSATNAGLKTIITVNEYTNNHNFDGALVVLDSLGDAQQPFTMISGSPTNTTCVDVDYLRSLHAKYC